MPVIAGVNCGRPNQLQTTFPAFSPLINGAANTRLCDGARGNQLKAIGPRFPASAKGPLVTRWKSRAVVMIGLVLATGVAAGAAERASSGGPQWPNLSKDGEARWP